MAFTVLAPKQNSLLVSEGMLKFFISVFNQFDAQNLSHNKFYFIPLHVSSTCANHQEVKIALHSLWYHHTIGERLGEAV